MGVNDGNLACHTSRLIKLFSWRRDITLKLFETEKLIQTVCDASRKLQGQN